MTNNIRVVLEIAASKVLLTIGKQENLEMNVLGYSECAIDTQNEIGNSAYVNAVKTVVRDINSRFGYKLNLVDVVFSDDSIKTSTHKANVEFESQHPISYSDLNYLYKQIHAELNGPESRVLHIIPKSFLIDGLHEVKNPLGMNAAQLQVDTYIVTVSTLAYERATKIAINAGLQIDNVLCSQFCNAELQMATQENRNPLVIVDIGHSMIGLTVLKHGTLVNCSSFKIGANTITTDLMKIMQITWKQAEELKIKHGSCSKVSITAEHEMIVVKTVQGIEYFPQKRQIAEYIIARVRELFSYCNAILQEVNENQSAEIPYFVLVGGGSKLEDIFPLARKVLQKTSLNSTKHLVIGDWKDDFKQQQYTSTLGAFVFGFRSNASSRHIAEYEEPVVLSPKSESKGWKFHKPNTWFSKQKTAAKDSQTADEII